MNKILSVIIPSYNIEQYIGQCLDSFVLPSVMKDIEILVINDGSKDTTPQLAKKYEQKYPDIFKVIDKENGGHGSTINKGIEIATGKYFKVVDGDDWVLEEGFINLVNYLKQVDDDIVFHNYLWVNAATGQTKHEFEEPFKGVQYRHSYTFDEIADSLYLKMHGMTYRTTLLREHQIRLDEHRFYVDTEYVLLPIPFVNKISFLQDDVYMYRLGIDGQSMNIKSMQKNISHHLGVLDTLLNYYANLSSEDISAPKLRYMERGIGRILSSQFKIYLSLPISKAVKLDMITLDSKIKIQYPNIYQAVINKSVWLLRKSHYSLYGIAARVLQKRLGL